MFWVWLWFMIIGTLLCNMASIVSDSLFMLLIQNNLDEGIILMYTNIYSMFFLLHLFDTLLNFHFIIYQRMLDGS